MNTYMGLDASTQSLTSLIVDVDSGRIVDETSVHFGKELPQYNCLHGFLESPEPLIKHADPLMWAAALDLLFHKLKQKKINLSDIKGISGSAQQHGTVYLNDRFLEQWDWAEAVDLPSLLKNMLSRPTAPIWMDSSTCDECREIAAAVEGNEVVRQRTGSRASERFAAPQIRRFYKNFPERYDKTAVIHLVSSFFCSLLTGSSSAIDYGDGAGMNLMNISSRAWDPLLLEATAPNLGEKLPALTGSQHIAGSLAPYFVEKYGFSANLPVVCWSGDNPNSLIGVGAWHPGIAVVSLGTSDTYFSAISEPAVDPNGYGNVFANPAGGYMSLICFKNGALARDKIRSYFDLTWQDFEKCLEQTPPGNNGNMMVPYFVPEITPVVLEAHVSCCGNDSFLENEDACTSVRAVIEAQAMRLKLYSAWMAQQPTVLRVTGGGAANVAICQVIADVFNARVERLETVNSAALGAAIRTANATGKISWEKLSANCCEKLKLADIVPAQKNVEVYRDMLPAYKRFAESYDEKSNNFDKFFDG